MSLGLIDGRNIWRADLEAAHKLAHHALARMGNDRLILSTSCSLLHVPYSLELESGLDDELKSWLAFAQEKLGEIEALIANAIGINADRGDSLTVSSSTFVSALEGVEKPWYDMDWAVTIMRQGLTILIMAVVVLGVIRPLINRIMVPAAQGGPGEAVVTLDDDVDLDTVEIQEGESLEDIKAKLKPKKAAISPEMLDTANTYDDKVAVIRMIVSDEAGRVSNVFKTMMQKDMDTA